MKKWTNVIKISVWDFFWGFLSRPSSLSPMIRQEIMCWLLRAIVDHERMVSAITAWGVQWTGLPHSPKTKGDRQIEDNLGRYYPKTFETAKRKCCGSVAERWRLKPEALGLTLGTTTFLSFPLPIQRSLDSTSPDCLWLDDHHWISDCGESRPLDSPCCNSTRHPSMVMLSQFYHFSWSPSSVKSSTKHRVRMSTFSWVNNNYRRHRRCLLEASLQAARLAVRGSYQCLLEAEFSGFGSADATIYLLASSA